MPTRSRSKNSRKKPRSSGPGEGNPDVRVRWSGLGPLVESAEGPIKRYYKLETLANATERLIHQHDRFIVPSVQQVLGAAPVVRLSFNLLIETASKLIFHVSASNAKRKRGALAFIVAKNDAPYSAQLAGEHGNLRRLREQAPKSVFRAFKGGRVFLPDRHRRAGHGREIFAYMAKWPSGYRELGIGKNRCFFVQGDPPQPLTDEQTEALKAQMVTIIAETYNPTRLECMAMPDVTQLDFLATRPQRGAMKLKLIGCRGMLKYMTPAKVIHRIVAASCPWQGSPFRLAPEAPERLFEALIEALGEASARDWFSDYRDSVTQGKLSAQEELPMDALDDMGIL